MKVIIAGGKNFSDHDLFCATMKKTPFKISQIVCGAMSGADTFAINWANCNNIPVVTYEVCCFTCGCTKVQGVKCYDNDALFVQNVMMSEYSDALITFPGGKGTNDLIARMSALKKQTMVVDYFITRKQALFYNVPGYAPRYVLYL